MQHETALLDFGFLAANVTLAAFIEFIRLFELAALATMHTSKFKKDLRMWILRERFAGEFFQLSPRQVFRLACHEVK